MFIKTQILSIKKSITSLSKIKFYLYKKLNAIFNKMSNFIFIKNQILSLSKIKIYLYQKSNFMFIKILLIFAINYLDEDALSSHAIYAFLPFPVL